MMPIFIKHHWRAMLLVFLFLSVSLPLLQPSSFPPETEHWARLILPNLAVGSIAGVLAGLLGIGGGLVIVPMMLISLGTQNVSQDVIMHMALGTSMASIVFTSISSFSAHHKRGAVRWDVVRRITVGILLGTFAGTFFVSLMDTRLLKFFFVIFVYYVAIQMLLNYRPKPSRTLPKAPGMFVMGNLIGVVSSMVGIGGGSLSVPFMTWCNIPVHTAIGTSAAIGFPIAIAGTFGYITNGIGDGQLPQYSLGYLHLPALAGIVAASMLTAPVGVRMAHSLPVARLKRVFALLLIVVGSRLMWGLFA